MCPRTQERKQNSLLDIALGSEYDSDNLIHKIGPNKTKVIIRVHDVALLDMVQNAAAEINATLSGDPFTAIVQQGPAPADPSVHIIDVWHQKPPRKDNDGLFIVKIDRNTKNIEHADVYISPDVSQEAKIHLCLEEIVQSLGLMNDSCTDPDSVFFQDWSYTPKLTKRDKELLRLLYMPKFQSGQTRSQVEQLLSQ